MLSAALNHISPFCPVCRKPQQFSFPCLLPISSSLYRKRAEKIPYFPRKNHHFSLYNKRRLWYSNRACEKHGSISPASKGGVIALTKTTAKELGSRNIRCNAVAPGFIQSKMTDVLPDDVKKSYMDMIPLKRFGTAEDIAKAVAWLAGEDASYVTGQIISVNGGMLG